MKEHPRLRHYWRLTLLLVLLTITANAQEFRGSLTGRVTDPNGAAMPGASASITNLDTNITATTTTNEDGNYTFQLLQPGKYTVSVTQQGFKKAVREKIELRVADRLTLDIQLEIGVAEELTIVGSGGPVLETGSVSTGTVVTSQQLSELPLTEGTAYQLATLTPGVFYTGNPQFSGPTSNGNLAGFRANGATGRNQVTLDGSPNYAIDGGVGFSPPADAVQEFKVQTNQFDAQQGYSAGATVNVAVKSGTNALHGTLNYFNRDKSRSANNFFANSTDQTGRPPTERTYHRFGGVVNGPVYIPGFYNGRDKTFFLFSYERLRDNAPEPQLFTVPTVKMRNGDFSDFLALSTPTVIYNPYDRIFTSPTAYTRAPFTGNIIPAGMINKAAQAYLNYYPLPNIRGAADGTNNYFSNMNRTSDYRAFLTRLDHRISDRQSIFGKFYHSFNPENRYDWAGVINGFAVTKGVEYRTNDGASLDYTLTMSSTTVLDIRVNLSRFIQERRPGQSFDPATLGLSAAALATMGGYQYLPRFDIRTYDATRPVRSTLGSNRSDYDLGLYRPFYVGSFQPTVTRIFGNHAAKFGYDLRVLRENYSTDGYQGGRLFFDGQYTSQTINPATAQRNLYGRDVAAFLLGQPSDGSSSIISQRDNPINYSAQSVYHGLFVHDDWRVTPKLTLNLGLRYDMEQGTTERYNRLIRGFDLTSASPIEAAALAAYTAAYNTAPTNFVVTPDQFHVRGGITYADQNNRSAWNLDRHNFQPRIGAAYQLDQKTVVRGGFGIFMAPFMIETPSQGNFSGATPFVASNNNGIEFVANLDNPFPTGLTPSTGAGSGLASRVGLDLGSSDLPVLPLDRKNAKFARLIFGFQRELPGQFIVEASFVTAWGYNLGVARNLNFVPVQYLGTDPASAIAANTALTGGATSIPNPFRGLAQPGSTLNTATTITRAQSLMAFPQFTNFWVQQSNGSNRYNSLQFQAQKRFATGFSLTGTYTWSRLRERVNYLNATDTELENRISPDERPHRYTIASIYQLPVGKGRKYGAGFNNVLDTVLGGWQMNGTYEWQSGEPFLFNNPLYYNGDVSQLRARVGEKDDQGLVYGINRSAFDSGLVRLSAYGLRNVPTTLDNLRNQPYLNVNLSLSKSFSLSETKRLQFRAESLNAFNHPYFGNGLNLDPSNASFGTLTTQRNNPREIQLGLKLTF
ncbi:MAG TPA: carboxypeptidase regulatory-like domain-containing protein [Blastocatellia bacterium]|nr:carboxypeptidase regulatory-like domain-containing protein [Blastocatellia bacterium]